MLDLMPTKEELNKLFDYKDGVLFWSLANPAFRRCGYPVGTINSSGRLTVWVRVQDKKYSFLVHRIIYKMHHGVCPVYIDHRDNNPLNNRIDNLRPATKAQNNHNARTRRDNTSGVKGVSWNENHQRWDARVMVHGHSKSIGRYLTVHDAACAIKTAREELHGGYARHA